MGTPKLLDKLNKLMGLDDKASKKEIKKLRKVLGDLKKKQVKLTEKLENAEGEHERRKLKQQIEVITRQRQKGVELYQSLKQARK